MCVVSIPGKRRTERLTVNFGSAYTQLPSAASAIEEMSPPVNLQDVLQSEVKYVILISL